MAGPMTPAIPVDPGNAAQLEAWDGGEGAYWAAHADAYDASVRHYHRAFLDAADIAPGHRLLDVGCGGGRTTIDAATRAGSGSALGVDLSHQLLDVARRRAEEEGVGNATFRQADAQVHAFEPESFDIVISRTGAMFFADPSAALGNLARASRPDGRLALLVWQPVERNEWFRAFTTALAAGRPPISPPPGAPGPFSLSDPDGTRSILEGAGWAGVEIRGSERPMWFGPDADTARDFVLGQLGWLIADLPEDRRRTALDALHAVMADHQTPDGVLLGSATWTVTASRS